MQVALSKEPLLPHQIVYRVDDAMIQVISDQEAAKLPEGMQEAYRRYGYRGQGKDRLDGLFYYCTDDSRFMNHAREPNLIWKEAWMGEHGVYIAAWAIPADTELTCDYADFSEPDELCFQGL